MPYLPHKLVALVAFGLIGILGASLTLVRGPLVLGTDQFVAGMRGIERERLERDVLGARGTLANFRSEDAATKLKDADRMRTERVKELDRLDQADAAVAIRTEAVLLGFVALASGVAAVLICWSDARRRTK